MPMTAHVGSFSEAAACCARSAACNIWLTGMRRGHEATPVGTDYALGCCAGPPLQVITPRQGAMSVEYTHAAQSLSLHELHAAAYPTVESLLVDLDDNGTAMLACPVSQEA